MSRSIHKLKARRLETLSTPGWYGDGGGLWLRIKTNGSKSWKFIWNRDKVRREMGLGSYAAYTLDDAREMAAAARNLLKEGHDPIELRQAEKEEEKVEREKAKQEAQPAAGPQRFLSTPRNILPPMRAVDPTRSISGSGPTRWRSTQRGFATSRLIRSTHRMSRKR